MCIRVIKYLRHLALASPSVALKLQRDLNVQCTRVCHRRLLNCGLGPWCNCARMFIHMHILSTNSLWFLKKPRCVPCCTCTNSDHVTFMAKRPSYSRFDIHFSCREVKRWAVKETVFSPTYLTASCKEKGVTAKLRSGVTNEHSNRFIFMFVVRNSCTDSSGSFLWGFW